MILKAKRLIPRSREIVRGFIRGTSKEEVMADIRTRLWEPKIRNRNNRLSALWQFRCLSPLLLVALGCVPAAAQCDVYVAAYKTNHVEVFNTFTKTLVAEIPVQVQPLGVAITPNGAFAYVTNSGKICDICAAIQSPSVSVIDTSTYQVVATIPVGNYPIGDAITPDGAFAYVANFNSNNVSVIDTVTNTVTATVGVGTGPTGVAITPNGAFAYVTNYYSDSISVINTATKTVVATVAVGSNPWAVATTPNGAFAYVTNQSSRSVSVINTATNAVVASIAVGCGPGAVAITPNGAFVYVATSCDSQVSVISTATNAVVATVGSLNDPRSMAITPDGAFAYVGNEGSGSLSVIDTATNTVVDTVLVAGTQLQGIAIKLRPDALTHSCR